MGIGDWGLGIGDWDEAASRAKVARDESAERKAQPRPRWPNLSRATNCGWPWKRPAPPRRSPRRTCRGPRRRADLSRETEARGARRTAIAAELAHGRSGARGPTADRGDFRAPRGCRERARAARRRAARIRPPATGSGRRVRQGRSFARTPPTPARRGDGACGGRPRGARRARGDGERARIPRRLGGAR